MVVFVASPHHDAENLRHDASHTFALSALGIVFLNIGCVIAGLLVDRTVPGAR